MPDLRNSRVPDIVAELREFGIAALVADPLADPAEAKREYGVELVPLEGFTELDGLILAVPHRVLGEAGWDKLFGSTRPGRGLHRRQIGRRPRQAFRRISITGAFEGFMQWRMEFSPQRGALRIRSRIAVCRRPWHRRYDRRRRDQGPDRRPSGIFSTGRLVPLWPLPTPTPTRTVITIIQVAPGTYTNDFSLVTRPMTIEVDPRRAGSPVLLEATVSLPNQKGIILTFASLTVDGLTFLGAMIDNSLGGNGAGIRDQNTAAGATLIVRNSVFTKNQEGILTGDDHRRDDRRHQLEIRKQREPRPPILSARIIRQSCGPLDRN